MMPKNYKAVKGISAQEAIDFALLPLKNKRDYLMKGDNTFPAPTKEDLQLIDRQRDLRMKQKLLQRFSDGQPVMKGQIQLQKVSKIIRPKTELEKHVDMLTAETHRPAVG